MVNLTLVSTLLTVTLIFIGRCSAQKPATTSKSLSLAPTLAPGNSDYKLLGCYTELPANPNARAVGVSNKYYAPLFATPDTVDVPSCLKACSISLAPNDEGTWIFAAVENSRECFCGLTLSNSSHPVDTKLCSSPCAGNVSQSCGGFGVLTLYQHVNSPLVVPTIPNTSEVNTTSSSTTPTTLITSTSSTTSTPLGAQPPTTLPSSESGLSHSQESGIIAGSILGFFLLLALLAYIFRVRLYFHIDHPNHSQDPPSLSVPIEERARRDSLDAWKRGIIPPLSPTDDSKCAEMPSHYGVAELDVGNAIYPPPQTRVVEIERSRSVNIDSPLISPRSLVSDFSLQGGGELGEAGMWRYNGDGEVVYAEGVGRGDDRFNGGEEGRRAGREFS